MNDRELMYVKTIAETKSISKAAQKLFIAQPSLSQAIQRIEDDLGTKLFIRKHDGISLTMAGEKYYLAATEILNIYEDYKNEVTYINDLKRGRVTIGITVYMGTHLIPKLLPKFMEDFPNIEIYIKELDSFNMEKALLDGTIDFAVMHTHPLKNSEPLNHEVLYKDPFMIVTKKDHPLSKYAKKVPESNHLSVDLKLFKDERFIMLRKDRRIRQVCDIIFHREGINPTTCLTLQSYESARRLASTGYGITMIPLQYIGIFEGQYEADYFYIEDNEYAFWYTCISTNPNMYLSKAANVFINLIRDYFIENQPI